AYLLALTLITITFGQRFQRWKHTVCAPLIQSVRAHQMSCKPSLETSQIYLRSLLMSDVDQWYSYISVPEVVEHTSWSVKSKQDLVNLVESYNLDDPES